MCALYTQTYTFSNGITADGGQVQTEITALGQSVNNITNAQIASDAAIAISKTALTTFTDWTADSRATTTIWTATANPAIGNGVFNAQYMQLGKMVIWQVRIQMGSTTTFGTGAWKFTLPIAAANTNGSFAATGAGKILDAGNVYYLCSTEFLDANTIDLVVDNNGSNVQSTVPQNPWAGSDILWFQIIYQAA